MDPRERVASDEEVMRSAMDDRQANMWTSLPGIVESFDATEMTLRVQCALTFKQTMPDESVMILNMPILADVPVMFPTAGGYTITFPIKAGDECLVFFASRCIDNWWEQGGVQPQREFRMHDLSDSFAILGPKSLPRVIKNISTTTMQIRTDDGKNYVEIDEANNAVNVVTTAKVTVNTVEADVNATNVINLNAPQTITSGDFFSKGRVIAGYGGTDQVTLQGHVHGTGGGNVASATVPPTANT